MIMTFKHMLLMVMVSPHVEGARKRRKRRRGSAGRARWAPRAERMMREGRAEGEGRRDIDVPTCVAPGTVPLASYQGGPEARPHQAPERRRLKSALFASPSPTGGLGVWYFRE